MADATVRLQALDGGWEVVGKDRLAGITPEGISLSANAWGSDTCRFTLRRDPTAVHPDLGAFTPCEVEVAGTVVWSGRVWETPTKDGDDASISVEGRGWQYHLDDDVYTRMFARTRLSDFVDQRSLVGANLGVYKAAGQVNADGSAILLILPNGTSNNGDYRIGATLDLGPDPACWAKRMIVNWAGINGSAGGTEHFWIWGTDGEDATSGESFDQGSTQSITNGVARVTFTSTRRYVHLVFRHTFNGATSPDQGVRISGVKVFSATAFESGDASVVKASDVVKDALAHAPLLDQSTAGISTTAFSITEFFFTDYKTPREVVGAVNAYHNYRARVAVDKSLRFDPYPTLPKYSAGAWQGVEFEDASANSGESIYNRCVLQATGPDGNPLSIIRTSGENYASTSPAFASDTTFSNPGFETNTTGWAVEAGPATLSRTTTASEFFEGTAGGKLAATGVAQVATSSFTGTFRAGRTYRISFFMRASATVSNITYSFMDVPSGLLANRIGNTVTTSFVRFETTFTPSRDLTAPKFVIASNGAATLFFDAFKVEELRPTLVDRRLFARTMILPIDAALNTTAGQQVADVFLANHKTTPLRGGASVKVGGLRIPDTGAAVHPSTLLADTGELIRFTNRIDPDTGSLGRDGRIASVTYDHNTESASVAIDNERKNFEALVARLAVLSPR